jgi:histidinol-phosphate aminotransferase
MGFRDYYRQFEEMRPEEISAELLALRDERRRRALSRIDPLDLSGTGWHEPPHPDAVNAATFALRRALNTYPDRSAGALRAALAERHGLAQEQVAVGHGAGELLRAVCAALLAGGGDALVAWPGWQPLPGLVEAAGGRAVPFPSAPAELLAHAGPDTRVVLVTSPSDPTGATLSRRAVHDLCARVPDGVTVVVDEALGEFAANGDDAAPLVADVANLVVVRSFSKAHAMAGFRAGYAIGPGGAGELLARLAPTLGISAPAQAGMTWAAANGERYLPRRREHAATERDHLAAVLTGTDFAFPRGSGPLLWLSSAALSGRELAAGLATKRIFVAPGAAWGDDRHVRITLRGPAATDRLAAALKDLTGDR